MRQGLRDFGHVHLLLAKIRDGVPISNARNLVSFIPPGGLTQVYQITVHVHDRRAGLAVPIEGDKGGEHSLKTALKVWSARAEAACEREVVGVFKMSEFSRYSFSPREISLSGLQKFTRVANIVSKQLSKCSQLVQWQHLIEMLPGFPRNSSSP